MNQWRETTLLTGVMESQDGIQRLLAAEQEAQAIVNAARQGTTFVFSLTRPPHRRPVAPKRRADSSTAPTDVIMTEKTARLRQAKEEADAEVAAYRAQREAAYQEKLSQVRARTRPNSAQIPGALNLQIEEN
jgi:V-type H+-transporting ATPase subunit G